MSGGTAGNPISLLDQVNKCMIQMLPSDTEDTTQGCPMDAQVIQASAVAMVDAIAGIQQYLRAFTAAPPLNKQQQLEQEVQLLEQELSKAEQLLLKTDYIVQQWQSRCQEMRAQHEAVLTDGISTQPRIAPATNS